MKLIHLFYLLWAILVLSSCHTLKSNTNESNPSVGDEIVRLEGEDWFDIEDDAVFVIKNISKQRSIYIYQPHEMTVQQKVKDQWERVELLFCPCGASCPPPPEWEILAPGSEREVVWDLQEKWCEQSDTRTRIPKTVSRYAGPGEFRIVVQYALSRGGEIKTLYKNFQLK